MKTIRITICGRNASTVPTPPRAPSITSEAIIPWPSRGRRTAPSHWTNASHAAVAGSAMRNTAANIPLMMARKSSGPPSGCKSTRSIFSVRSRRGGTVRGDAARTITRVATSSGTNEIGPGASSPRARTSIASTASRPAGSCACVTTTGTPSADSSAAASSEQPSLDSASDWVTTTQRLTPASCSARSAVSLNPSARFVASMTCSTTTSSPATRRASRKSRAMRSSVPVSRPGSSE
jgi:hypothetical protein